MGDIGLRTVQGFSGLPISGALLWGSPKIRDPHESSRNMTVLQEPG